MAIYAYSPVAICVSNCLAFHDPISIPLLPTNIWHSSNMLVLFCILFVHAGIKCRIGWAFGRQGSFENRDIHAKQGGVTSDFLHFLYNCFSINFSRLYKYLTGFSFVLDTLSRARVRLPTMWDRVGFSGYRSQGFRNVRVFRMV